MAETDFNDFREDKITITRGEFSTVIADTTTTFYNNVKAEYGDEEMATAYNNLLIAFGASLMTTMFDEGRIEDLKIEEN